MSREEAIYIMMNSNEYHHAKGDLPYSALSIEAFNMAIEALKEERPQGEWEWQTEDKYRCTNCGEVVRVKEVMNVPQYNFCPMCSADMRKSLASYE